MVTKAKKSAKKSVKAKAKKVVKKVLKKGTAKSSFSFKPTKIKLLRPVPSDINVAQAAKLKPILQIANEYGIRENELELYGPYKAKVKLDILERFKNRPDRKSTRLNSSHSQISYAVFCLKKKKIK